MRNCVGPEQNAVLVAFEEPARRARLPPEFPNSRSQFDGHVREPVQIVRDILEVFGEIAHMQDKELRLGMARHHVVARLQQIGIAREVAAVERPVGVVVQLFVALVVFVGRSKKSNGIRNVDGDRHPQLAAGIPHRIESRVVDLDELAGGDTLAQIQAESLQDLKPPRPLAPSLFDGLRLERRVTRLQKTVVARFSKRIEPSGKSSIVTRDRIRQPCAKSSGEIHHSENVPAFHHG